MSLALQGADERRYWLALHRAPGIGALTYRRLLEQFKTPRGVFGADASALAAAGIGGKTLDYLKGPDWAPVQADLDWLAAPRRHLLTLADDAYPSLLRELPDPPSVLFVEGNPEALASVQLALVGSRNPTAIGKEIAYQFAKQLSSIGVTITSGLAVGIDAAGHRGALAGNGVTIAVAGTGLDRVYPARHQELAERIADRGALVSEFPVGVAAHAENFPRRNRIISGLSVGTLVIEAAIRSGSLITARHAMEQGREVFAIPGSIHNPLARGCHALIRQGAKLVETVQDILEELGPLAETVMSLPELSEEAASVKNELDADYKHLLENVGYEPTTIDTLVERTGLTANVVSSMLLILELRGYVTSQPGGTYARSALRV
ncbi:MAG: DNA-processing protein DprA [Gammaproteobacteria bacterium]|nr:DNA-processing protein DprA [Gammaproteobacteria bacterium]MCI0590579.1 DNA-processing protein DprA [Gammaproteobacteria bacterium]